MNRLSRGFRDGDGVSILYDMAPDETAGDVERRIVDVIARGLLKV
ncbi:unnamed protein product [Haemonchus placei]|uniref:Uncharacterized protein n=1 Tax=Haemonchus placei TaxID=6290 RepID=A0A3P7WC38_HAEPC|nr:unnamed protein product [Haemonchus placei]